MGIVVNANIMSLIAQSNLTQSTNSLNSVMERLSSGSRINRASDDAAGLAVSEVLKGQISANSKVKENVQNAKNMLAIADGGLNSVMSNLQRISDLCLQASNETYDEKAKDALLMEVKARLKSIDSVAETNNFNGLKLLNGPFPQDVLIQTGTGSALDSNTINIGSALQDVHVSQLGGNLTIPNTVTAANWATSDILDYIGQVDDAMKSLTSSRAQVGAFSNRFDSIAENLTVSNLNLQEAKSTILDTDVALESSEMVRFQILQQTTASILTQANQMPALALSLLGISA